MPKEDIDSFCGEVVIDRGSVVNEPDLAEKFLRVIKDYRGLFIGVFCGGIISFYYKPLADFPNERVLAITLISLITHVGTRIGDLIEARFKVNRSS